MGMAAASPSGQMVAEIDMSGQFFQQGNIFHFTLAPVFNLAQYPFCPVGAFRQGVHCPQDSCR